MGDNDHCPFEQDAPSSEQNAPDPPPHMDPPPDPPSDMDPLVLENDLTPRGNSIPWNIMGDQFTGDIKNHLS